jgi:hypothetical protein
MGTPPRCLAHIINLVTHAVISTKSKYYNGDPADDHIPKDKKDDSKRDEVGIIWAICIRCIVYHIQLASVLI